MEIRYAKIEDLDKITEVEALCFPPAEAAGRESFARRIDAFGSHFWLLFDGERLVSFVNGMVSSEADLRDAMYDDASLHDEDGEWQMIFGVDTIPEYRKRGCAGLLLRRAIEDARNQGRKGLVLTCKEHMLAYYGTFGFINEGMSGSVHGGAVWYQMRLTFPV